MLDSVRALSQGTLHALVAPLVKDTTSVLRPSHHRAPPKKKGAPQMSKAQIAETIQQAATGLTFCGPDETMDESEDIGVAPPPGAAGRKKRKRPPQLTAAMGEVARSARRSLRSTRASGRLISPSEFAPSTAVGQLETPVGMPTPGNTPWGICLL